MADLTYGQSALLTSITGADSTGAETNIVNADSNGNLLVKPASNGPVTPGTVATFSSLVGGQFNTSLPTLTNTQQSAIQVDSSGRLLVSIASSIAVTGPLTDTQLRATPVPVSGTVTANQGGTWNVTNISGTVSLPTGASTSALQTSGNASLSTIATNTPALGQATMANSSPVVIASNQSALAVTGTFFQATQPVSIATNVVVVGTATDNTANSTAKLPALVAVATTAAPSYTNTNMVPLSTDLTGALRITGSISASNPSVSTTGSAPPASATYVGGSVTTSAPAYSNGQMSALSLTTGGLLRVDASGTVQPISATSLPLPTGAATETTLATRAASSQLPAALVGARLDTNTGAWLGSTAPTVGVKTMAESLPVVIASDQTPISITQAGSSEVTFTVMSINTTLSNNKSLISVWNPTGSGVKIKLREFYIRNPQTSAVTGVAGDFRIYRFAKATAPTGGSALTPVLHDTADAIVGSLDCRSGATDIGTEEANPLDRMIQSTDEWGPGTLDQEGAQQTIANYLPARAKRDAQVKAFTINSGQGIHLKFATNSTAGTQDIIMVFTQV